MPWRQTGSFILTYFSLWKNLVKTCWTGCTLYKFTESKRYWSEEKKSLQSFWLAAEELIMCPTAVRLLLQWTIGAEQQKHESELTQNILGAFNFSYNFWCFLIVKIHLLYIWLSRIHWSLMCSALDQLLRLQCFSSCSHTQSHRIHTSALGLYPMKLLRGPSLLSFFLHLQMPFNFFITRGVCSRA